MVLGLQADDIRGSISVDAMHKVPRTVGLWVVASCVTFPKSVLRWYFIANQSMVGTIFCGRRYFFLLNFKNLAQNFRLHSRRLLNPMDLGLPTNANSAVVIVLVFCCRRPA